MGDFIVISILTMIIILAVKSMWKDHKKGGCAGCSRKCANYSAGCPGKNI